MNTTSDRIIGSTHQANVNFPIGTPSEHKEARAALEKVIEKARYESDMARGEFMHMRIEDGLWRLDRALNVLKFKDPEHPSLK